MPVWKFRTHDEAQRALWADPGDPAVPERLRRLWELSYQIAHTVSPRGIRKFRTIEEANRDRETWPVVTPFKRVEGP